VAATIRLSHETGRLRSTHRSGTKAPFFVGLILFAGLVIPTNASAAFINFFTTSPITHSTNLATTSYTADSQTASYSGVNSGAVSDYPVASGKRAAGLYVPGNPSMISDYILLDAADPVGIPPAETQVIAIEFHTVDILLSNFSTLHPGYTWTGALERDGTLQDLSAPALLNTYPVLGEEGTFVRVQSSAALAAGLPEPGTFAIAGVGLLLLGFTAWRYRRSR